MFNKHNIKDLNTNINNIIFGETISLRQHYLSKMKIRFSDETDWILSMSFMFKDKVNLKVQFNNLENFDFSKDIGKLFFIYQKNDRKELQEFFYTLPYEVQKLFQVILSNTLESKLTEDFILLSINKFYILSDLFLKIELPDILPSLNFSIQSIKREVIKDLEFPIYTLQIPVKYKKDKVLYFVKDGDKITSNIPSGVIRSSILGNIDAMEYGVIGVLVKAKGYKKRYKFILCYYNTNYNNVLNLYKGNKDKYDNQLNSLNLKPVENLTTRGIIKLSTEEELKNYQRKFKSNKNLVLMNDLGVFIYSTEVVYDYGEIVDYIYDENYEALGLVVEYLGKLYKIYFNVMTTSYTDSIENRFVKLAITKFKGVILKVSYNSEVKKWSKVSDSCKICYSVKYKHSKAGVCNKCVSRLYNFTKCLGAGYKEVCEKDFSIYVNGYFIFTKDGYVFFEPDKGKQLTFKFDDEKFCKEE